MLDFNSLSTSEDIAKKSVPERSARKAPQIVFPTGKPSKKRADCSKRTAANQHTLPDHINNLFF
jgi:hypothetical protein